ncbi:MAG: PQQ-dependent dehydrogenase, methanol/ethanol family [Tepidisphaeraceae bacterium]
MRKEWFARTVLGLLSTTTLSVASAQSNDWPVASKDGSCQRFSELNQINTENAKSLRVAWTFSTGITAGNEAAPIVVGSTMYVITPYPNILFALDLSRDGELKWKYEAKTNASSQSQACCGTVCRGAAYADGKVIFNALDGRTIAVDAETGKEAWQQTMTDYRIGDTLNMAPLIVGDKVLLGNSGSQFGARGWIAALNVKDGKVAWKAFNTGPDADCLIGPDFKPFYAGDRGQDLGVKSWPPGKWKIGGGTVWGWISYDPQLDLIFHGTGDPAPWNNSVRDGDNKWCSGIFARRPSTGEAVWFYQYTPHDLYGHDGINESTVVDLELKPGEGPRKVLLHADRNGHLYVMDRTTGEVLSATPFVRTSSYKGVDLKTGRMQFVDEKKPEVGKVVRDIAPAAPGGKDWQPSAYSPRTKLLYLPHQTLSMDFEETDVNYIAGTPYIGAKARFYADPVDPGDGNMGRFTAWDPAAQKAAWKITEKFPVWSGAVVTAGDVVFYGTMDRWFKAVDVRSGKELWKFHVDSGIVSQPITYAGPDGKQYVAVLSGVGGWPGAIVVRDLKPEDPSSAHGFGNAMRELPNYTSRGSTLYVFALP